MILDESANCTWRDVAAQNLRTGFSGSGSREIAVEEFKIAADRCASFPTQPRWGMSSGWDVSWGQGEVL